MSEEIKEPVQTVAPEQLSEVKPEVKVEEKPAEALASTETPVVEQKEQLSEQPVVEKVEAPLEQKKESLSEEITKTKEELAVLKEAREELVALYAQYKDIKSEKEQLSKDLETLKSENSQVKEQLDRYVKAEIELNAKKRLDKIEKLSAKFKALGQDKTVEHLSAKEDAVLDEFETLVDAALAKAGETKVMPSVTVPAQSVSVEALASEEKKPSVEVKAAPKPVKREMLSTKDVLTKVLNDLDREQKQDKRNSSVKYF